MSFSALERFVPTSSLADFTPEDAAPHQLGEALEVLLTTNRPSEGVADDESPEPLGMTHRHGEPDRSAPVLDHHRDALQAELGDKAFDHPGVLGDRVAVPGPCGGETESRVVESDAPEPVLQSIDDVPVQE